LNPAPAAPALKLLRTATRGPAGQGAWFVNADAEAAVTLDWFEPRFWMARDAVVARHTGRGAAIGFEHQGRRFLLRHYLRGGMAAALSADRYLWLGEARTRPLAELMLTLRLHADGLPVPRPVAVRYERHGPVYTADIITDYLPDTRTLAAVLADIDLPLPVWADIGRTIRRFHEWGLDHADLNAHNILLNRDGEVFLIDFDKAGLRRRPGIWRDANLARLRRSLDALQDQNARLRFDETQWQVLLTAWFRSQ
jgi:3-deoxy-D-manno-octulosonic acid kinase